MRGRITDHAGFTYRGVTARARRSRGSARPRTRANWPRMLRAGADQRQQALRKGQGIQHPHVRNGRGRKGTGHLHAPVLGDDRRRLAAGPVPRDSRRAAGEQDLSEDPERRARLGRRRRDAFGRHEAVREGLRSRCTTTWWKRARRAVFSTRFSSAFRPTSKRTSS